MCRVLKTRSIGDMKVSEIGMGCMGFSHGYGQIPEESCSIEAIRRAYDCGCTFFDTAESYGSQLYYPGHNEKLLGKAVAPFRDKVVIATKFHFSGNILTDENEIECFMRERLRRSMENLQTEWIDLYYLHRLSRNIPIEQVAKVMGRFIQEGLIRGWGMSQVGVDTLAKAHSVTPISAVQNLYNMLERDCEKEVLPFCLKNGVAVVPFSPVASGFLSGKLTADSDFGHKDDVRKFVPQLSKDNFAANLPVIDLLETYAVNKNATKAQIALAWMLKKYPNVIPIPGSKNQGRILENLGASNVVLEDAEFAVLDNALESIKIYGHRGQEEYEDSTMEEWNR